jgi:heme-degrading monooxygenase HmoA
VVLVVVDPPGPFSQATPV